jgi:MHS family proline/betaine transporter-like MFS transporter
MPRRLESSDGPHSRTSINNGSSEDDQSFLTCRGDNDDDQDTIFHDQQEDDNDDSSAYDAIFKGLGEPSIPRDMNISKSPRSSKMKNNKTMQTIAGVAGNILEWYDFAVFGYFSDVLGEVFFPPQEGHKAIIESFAVFGLAFLCRPIGGVMMGYIGDVYGRKKALEISIFLMAFPTFAMGCLPSYARVGNWAIVLLILVRMLQGFSVGGQLVSSLVYTCENNPRGQWGLYGSFVMAAANFGTLLGGLISYGLRNGLSEEQLKSWGWRLPFLSGILVSLCGFYLKYYSDDDVIEHHHGGGGGERDVTQGQNPIKVAFGKGNRKALLASSLVPMLWSAGFYITFVWMATFMNSMVDPPVPGAFGVNSAALFISVCLFFPLAGILSDIFGRYKIMLLGGVVMGVLSPLMVIVISSGDSTAAFFAQSAMGIALSLWGAPSKFQLHYSILQVSAIIASFSLR